MVVAYERFRASEAEALADFLAGDIWPFHAAPGPAATGGPDHRAGILAAVAAGDYAGASVRTFWIVEDGARIGLVRLFDIGDGAPMFDLRLTAPCRGRGLGRDAVRWLTAYLFDALPEITRIEATTRQDNRAMRQVLVRCGYAKEAHYRQAWPAPDRTSLDAVGYAILRDDWSSGSVTLPDWNG